MLTQAWNIHTDMVVIVNIHTDMVVIVNIHTDMVVIVNIHTDMVVIVNIHTDMVVMWFLKGSMGYGYGVKRPFQQYFSYIVVVSFIGGGNRSTRRKPQTCRKSLTNSIT
jgi:hypothetical protein